jgi:acetyl esterase/lipase
MSSTTSRPASGVPGAASPPYVVEDCLGVLQILSDGTVKRAQPPLVLPDDDDAALPAADNAPVNWKDVVYDEANKLSLRTFMPNACAGDKKGKLPVLVFFHGGGFVVGTFAMPDFHAACLRLAAELPAVVLSVDYRLAPEHRLPAAHDDADTLLSWLRAQAVPDSTSADPWLAERADFRRVFLSGDSAGANIAHNAAVRAAGSGDGLRVAGCVLLWPYFGGERRTASEAACPADTFLTLALYDQMWRIALPAGASRDHPAANPVGPDSPALDAVDLPPLLVATGDRDMLVDRIRDYVARLKAAGKRVEIVEFAGQAHAFAIFNPESEDAGELVRVVRKFVRGGAAAPPS